MPVARFWARLEEHRERERSRDREDAERWIMGIWANCRALWFALTADHDLPPTQAEYNRQKKAKGPNWAKVERARKQQERLQREWQRAVNDPRWLGVLMKMGHILGEPPDAGEDGERPPKVIDHAEIRARERRIIAALQRHAEATGNAPMMA